MDRALSSSTLLGMAVVGVLTTGVLAAAAQPARPFRGAVSSSQPTGGLTNGTVASDAAYGERAGEGRSSTPTSVERAQASQDPQTTTEEFGRPNPGRPQFQDPDFRGDGSGASPDQTQGHSQPQQSASSEDEDDGQEDPTVLTVNDGFFFDNYTSGSGFGVYGGEAVTSGQERQLELPSAGLVARNLGLPIGPAQGAPTAPPPDASND